MLRLGVYVCVNIHIPLIMVTSKKPLNGNPGFLLQEYCLEVPGEDFESDPQTCNHPQVDRTWGIEEMGGCQNHGLVGPLITRCSIILRTQKGTIILTTTQIC